MAKRANGEGTIRKRKDGRYEGRLMIGYTPEGKKKIKYVYGKTQKECRDKLRAAAQDLADGVKMDPERLTLKRWLQIWMDTYCTHLKPTTLVAYERHVRVHVYPFIGDIELRKLRPFMIQQCINNIGDNKKALKTNTACVVRNALKQAVKDGLIKTNPAMDIVLPKREKPNLAVMDDETTARFVQAIKGNKYEGLFLMALYTGMREGELLGLQWKCVDFETGTILIDKQLVVLKGERILTSTKNGRARMIMMPPSVARILRQIKHQQNEHKLMLFGAYQDNDLVFARTKGEAVVLQSFRRHFKKAAEEAGVPNLRFHDLRHTYATNALRLGDDIKTVQTNLGHATAAFTMDVYVNETMDMKRDSADRMEGFIKSISG